MANLSCSRCGSRFEAKRSDAKYCEVCKQEVRKESQRNYERRRTSFCPDCGVAIIRRSAYCQSCMLKRRGIAQRGEHNPFWRGGKTMHAAGYVQLLVGGKQRYKFEHHIVWEAANGPLPQGWVIHHLNGVKADNRLENLAGMPRHEHHQHPRGALVPYEERIRQLENMLNSVTTERSQ